MMKRSRWIAAAGALIVMLSGCGVNEGTPTIPSEPPTTVESKVETATPTEASAMPETETDEVSTEATQETEIAERTLRCFCFLSDWEQTLSS